MSARRGNILYAWQVLEDGDWGIIAVVVGNKLVPLVHRSPTVIQSMKPLAQEHRDETRLPVRLGRFTFDREEERL